MPKAWVSQTTEDSEGVSDDEVSGTGQGTRDVPERVGEAGVEAEVGSREMGEVDGLGPPVDPDLEEEPDQSEPHRDREKRSRRPPNRLDL